VAELRGLIGGAHRTRLPVTVFLATVDHVSIPAAALAVAWLYRWSVPAAVVAGVVAACLVGRQLRAMECLVHEASHLNWSRHHRRANDMFAAVLCGWPAGIRIGNYRASHLVHHGRLGTDGDPDRQRYRELDIENLDRGSLIAFVRGLLPRLAAYQRGWLRATAADPVSIAMPVVWALLTIALPAMMLWGLAGAVTGLVVWAGGHTLALPVLRFIGESSEHSYTDADTVFDSTITNLGRLQRWLIHPHSDGYHTVHHLWPGTPHHGLRTLHRALMQADPDGYARRLRVRTRVLSSPSPNRSARAMASATDE
jgi:fatty acid desaturase